MAVKLSSDEIDITSVTAFSGDVEERVMGMLAEKGLVTVLACIDVRAWEVSYK